MKSVVYPLEQFVYKPIRLTWFWLTWEAVLTKEAKTVAVRKPL